MKKVLTVLATVVVFVTLIYAQSDYFRSVYIRTLLYLQSDATFTNTGSTTMSGTTTISGTTTVSGNATFTGIADFDSTITAGAGFWAGAPSIASNKTSYAFFWFEDFIGTALDTVATGDSYPDGWKLTADDGSTFAPQTGSLGGIDSLMAVTGSNNEAYLQLGETGNETFVEITKSSSKKLWFEVRFAVNDDDDAANAFVGLAEEGSSTANFVADAGDDIADKDFIGAIVYEGNPDTIKFIYQTSGSAFVVDDSTTIDSLSYHSFQFYFDGDSTCSIYWDNALRDTISINNAGFPDGEELSPIFGVKNGAADRALYVDWFKIVSER